LVSPGLISGEAAASLLRHYAAALEASPGSFAIYTRPGSETFASRDIAALTKYATDRAAARVSVYFHVHLHSLAEGVHHDHRGSIESVAAAIGLIADVDARGPGRNKPPEVLCPTAGHALRIVDEFNRVFHPLQTALTISSGYGCYPAILFKEPLLVEDAESRQKLEQLNRRFHLALHGIAEKYGWTGAVEYCDLAKVLRLPGTVNWKERTDPKAVRLIDQSAARFDPVELDELLPPLPKSTTHSTVSAIHSAEGANIVLRADIQVSTGVLRALRELHPRFADTWDHRRDDLSDQSCSGYDLALANMAVSLGLTDQQIADLLVVHRREFPGRRKTRRGGAYVKYLARVIGLAREGRMSSEAAAADWEQFDAALRGVRTSPGDTPPEDPEAGGAP
jgi:hypothetical protein